MRGTNGRRRSPGIALLVAGLLMVGLLGGGGACKKDEPAPGAPTGDAAATAAPTWTRPEPAADPGGALQALFEALQSRDRRAIAGALISVEECEAVAGERDRCARIAQRRAAFVELFARAPLPKDAHLTNIVLEKSIELTPEDQQLKRSVRIQPGVIQFRTGEGVSSLHSVAAIQVEGGWRALPGEPRPPQPAAGATDEAAPERPTPTAAPPAAPTEEPPSTPDPTE